MKKNRGLIIIICVAVTLIVVVNTLCVLAACYPELIEHIFGITIGTHLKAHDRVESSIISTGLSILGIAVAVWTGLNIANTIDKKRIDEIDEQIKSANRQTKEIKETVDTISNVRKQQIEIDKSKLHQEMYLSGSDMATKQLIEKFISLPNESTVPYMELLAIEQEFRIVFNMHDSRYSDNEELKSTAKHGIELAEALMLKAKNPIVILYLKFRIAEFHFYMGYCCLWKECTDHFKEAIKLYQECAEEFQADVPQFNDNEEWPNIKYHNCRQRYREISAYFCNTIGEAYSKIVHNNQKENKDKCSDAEIKQYGAQAVFYCAYATHWGDRAIYIRNFGCALERHYKEQTFSDKTLYKTLCSNYEIALKMEPKVFSNFKNMISAYDKYINNILEIKSVKLPNQRIPSLASLEFAIIWRDTVQKQEVLTTLECIKKMADTIKTLFPGDGAGYQYACIYFRDMCAIYGNHTLETDEVIIAKMKQAAKRYLEQAEENWSILNIALPYDSNKSEENPMTQILRNDLDDLNNLL